MESIHIFFNELRHNAGAIWLENGSINLSVPKKFQNQETKNFIVTNKVQIISILKENQIFSIEEFLSVLILRDNTIVDYPLSPSQERLWFIEQYEEGTNAFHIPTLYELESNTDVEGIKYGIRQIVSRHEVLRSTIGQLDNRQHGVQVVHDESLIIDEATLTDKKDYNSIIKEDINRPFNLGSEYPIRVKLFKIQSDKSASGNSVNRTLLLIVIHHIAGDGWSRDIFLRELYTYYEAYVNNDTDFRLTALELQYKDYAVWQRNYLTGEILYKQLSYWKTKLLGYKNLELPTDYVRPNKIDNRGAYKEFELDIAISQKLRGLAQRYGATLHSVMLSSVNILLSKYTGQNDIIIGSSIANRHYRQTEELIGFFVNSQAHRTLLNSTQSFGDLIQQTHIEQVEAQSYQDLPIEELIAELGVERDTSRNNIFQVMFSLQSFGNHDKASDQQKKYLKLIQAEGAYEIEKMDLSINIDDRKDKLYGSFSYAKSLFHKDTIARLTQHYLYLLAQLTETPEKPYSQISLLSSEEYDQIVYQWNDTNKDYPKDKTICQLFREQVEKTPDNIAVVYGKNQLTFKELNEKSNQLSRYIRKQYQQKTNQTLSRDTLIALYLDRSLEMLIGMLAVLKAGGAYVSLDISYPKERVDYILKDTHAELVLSQNHLSVDSQVELPQEKVINIDLTEELYQVEEISNPLQYSTATDLAYVIYTSGTTGQPKGVMVEHSSVNNEILSQLELVSLNSSDKSLLTANTVFDAAVECIYMSLFTGGSLHIVDKTSVLDSKFIKDYVENFKISVFNTTPSYLISIGINLFSTHIKHIILGGEVYQNIESSAKIYNTYGPTETTIVSTGGEVKKTENIGKPINNTRVYVLSQYSNPVPIGVIGELYIGGVGVARGYLNCPELTKERFVNNPFATSADKEIGYTRLYKTGDLVRWLPDGNIEFIGRNDDQIKIRGIRIEIGEIEHALAKIPGIKQSCVLVKDRKTEIGNNKYIAGYYVLDNADDTISHDTFPDKLSQVLPEYMIPSAFVPMESFPLTINGKLDKPALPEPNFSLSIGKYIAPTTKIEKEVCRVWQEVLGLERVGITDDFFRIGGNSILAIQTSHRMSKELSADVKVADLFKFRIINVLLKNVTFMQVNHENVELEF